MYVYRTTKRKSICARNTICPGSSQIYEYDGCLMLLACCEQKIKES